MILNAVPFYLNLLFRTMQTNVAKGNLYSDIGTTRNSPSNGKTLCGNVF